MTPPSREGYLPPTRTFDGDELALTIAGVRLQLFYTPGETLDTISVWLPVEWTVCGIYADQEIERRGERQIIAIAQNYHPTSAMYLLKAFPLQ